LSPLENEDPQEYPKGTPPLGASDISELVNEVPGWRVESDALIRDFEFKGFDDAFSFLARVALLAEAKSHHPDIWNSWNKVTLRFWTHTAEGLTRNDFIMAARINRFAD
jgi:4a-hydroxytetrahydrobiopterin dehydratase